MDIIEKLAQNVVETKYENLPREAVENTKKAVLDTLGVMIAGAPDCQKEVSLMKERGGKEESTVFTYGGKVPAVNAAWVNSVMASACDFDDGMLGPLHTSASTVPTALAVSEMRGKVSGKEFITAIAVGADLAGRIRLAMNCEDYGFQPVGTIVVFGAAAIAGKILRLDMRGMLNTLGIAFIRASGSHMVAADKVLCVRLTQGFASQAGVESALLAQRGLTGIKNVFQGTSGYFNLFSRKEPNLKALTDQLGQRYEVVRLAFKKFPSCGTTHAATEASLRLANQYNIDPRNVTQVVVEVSSEVFPVTGHIFSIGDNPRVEAQFSLQYTVANAIYRRGSKLEHFTENYVRDPAVVELAHKVHPILTNKIEGLSAFVEIEMKDGKKFSESVMANNIQRLTGYDELKEKFRTCLIFARESPVARNCEKIIDMINNLEEVDDVSNLVKLLV